MSMNPDGDKIISDLAKKLTDSMYGAIGDTYHALEAQTTAAHCPSITAADIKAMMETMKALPPAPQPPKDACINCGAKGCMFKEVYIGTFGSTIAKLCFACDLKMHMLLNPKMARNRNV